MLSPLTPMKQNPDPDGSTSVLAEVGCAQAAVVNVKSSMTGSATIQSNNGRLEITLGERKNNTPGKMSAIGSSSISVQEQVVSHSASASPTKTAVRSSDVVPPTVACGSVQLIQSGNMDTVDHSKTDSLSMNCSTNDKPESRPNGSSITDQRSPATPASTRSGELKTPHTVTKTPTFVNGTPSSTRKSGPRRRRASTPHPAALPDSAAETDTTTPQTTPEKSVIQRRSRRYLVKQKTNDAFPSSVRDSLVRSESPIERKSGGRKRGSKNKAWMEKSNESMNQEAKSETDQVDQAKQPSTEVEGVEMEKTTHQSEPLPEALTTEIEYPSFQTSGILDFEPDIPKDGSTQQSDPTEPTPSIEDPRGEAGIESKNGSKPRKLNPFVRRSRPPRPSPPPEEKIIVEKGTRPALGMLFEEYGVEFSKTKRPYLQYSDLEKAATQNSPNTDIKLLRAEFRKAFKSDSERIWPEQDVLMSPIDSYFVDFDETIATFMYDPRKEATVEFQRLALEAGWIPKELVWDVTNWDVSLKKFEKLWSDKVARQQRGKFKEACFLEFDQVSPSLKWVDEQLLGHIFFENVSMHQDKSSKDQDTSRTGKVWELTDYQRFLSRFDEPPRPSIRDCKEVIRENLNVNLYDLLDWFRNPETAARPQRFGSVSALGEYSYVQNKVFSLWDARESRIAKPLLRKIAQFRFRRWRRPFSVVVYSPASDATKLESSENEEKVKNVTEETSTGGIVLPETASMDTAKKDSTATIRSLDDESVKGKGVSLFTLSETGGKSVSRKGGRGIRNRRAARKAPLRKGTEATTVEAVAVTA